MENRLGTERIQPLILKLALPIMLSMALEALYNIIDSLFVARLGDEPIAALSLAYPIGQLIVAMTNGLGLGSSAVISRRLGKKDQSAANRAGNTAIMMALIASLVFLLFGSKITKAYVGFFTIDPQLIAPSVSYIGIMTCFCGFQILGGVMTFMLQGTGETIQTLICLAVGIVCNLILDPLFMFGFGWGVAGAAWASIIGQGMSFLIALMLLHKNDKLFCLRRHDRLWGWPAAGSILAIGLPTMLLQASGSISLTLVNKILISFTPLAVTAYGIYIKIESFIFLPMHGMSNAVIPIVSYNYGADQRGRSRSCLHWALLFTYLYMLGFGFPFFQLKPELLYRIFQPSPALAEQMAIAFPRVSLCFIGAPLIYLGAAYLQGFGKGVQAALITLCRQAFGVLPSTYLLAKLVGLNGVWYCYFFGDLVGQSVALVLILRLNSRMFSARKAGKPETA